MRSNLKRFFFSNKFKYIIFLLSLAIGLAITKVTVSYSDNVVQDLSSNLIRLHVIANSDSTYDQDLKRKVRDDIIKYMTEKFKNVNDKKTAKDLIIENLPQITEIAKKTLKKYNCNYEIKSLVGNFTFPTKSYGDIVLPAGNYDALRVVIGSGSGANWWCVMFPPLCFADMSKGVVPVSSKEQLRETLSKDDYEIITQNRQSVSINVKFKIVELVQNSKAKFAANQNKVSKK